MSTYPFPFPTLIEGFGEPEAWVVLTTNKVIPEVEGYSWRTSGYLSALRKMQHSLVENGFDPESGEWRVYEYEGDALLSASLVEFEPGDAFDRVILVVARGMKKIVE
jgi:hypothetical protein